MAQTNANAAYAATTLSFAAKFMETTPARPYLCGHSHLGNCLEDGRNGTGPKVRPPSIQTRTPSGPNRSTRPDYGKK
jgi:hypothetical protein